MELKWSKKRNGASPSQSSNRTFMELKYGEARITITEIERSNRTFMELKFRNIPQFELIAILF